MQKPTNKQRSKNAPVGVEYSSAPTNNNASKGRLDVLLCNLGTALADSFVPGLGNEVRPRLQQLAHKYLPKEAVPDELLTAARRAFFEPAHKGDGHVR